jgi:D-alanyl-lipoteichoic acid acyltransferase DltB (MBOAT superfamily)
MLFNSIAFAVFFILTLSSYWLLRRRYRIQNLLLLFASYYFYGFWDVRFLFLIVFSTVLDYTCALSIRNGHMTLWQRARASLFLFSAALFCLGINLKAFDFGFVEHWPSLAVDWQHVLVSKPAYWRVIFAVAIGILLFNAAYPRLTRLEPNHRRRFFLAMSVVMNLAMLGFFKYFDFFAASLQSAVESVTGHTLGNWTLGVILPVGISFFVFQTMSYTIDVYRGCLQPSTAVTEVAVFVSFFPQLVAGPIARASHLMPQFRRPRPANLACFRSGLWLRAWGLFEKMVVADNMARVVNSTFAPFSNADGMTPVPQDGLRLLLAIYAFAIQIYCDFAGYTDIARGTARLLGFDIMLNFRLPYLARNPSDFWKRWHISLSSWLRDYLYIPLGGNRHGTLQMYRNLVLTMLLGGLWHGAAWTFVLWGAFHGFILVAYRVVAEVSKKGAVLIRKVQSPAGAAESEMLAESLVGEGAESSGVVSVETAGGGSVKCCRRQASLRLPVSRSVEPTDVPGGENHNGLASVGVAAVQILIMFHLVCLGWLLFRAQNMATVGIFLRSIFLHPHWSPAATDVLWTLVFYGWLFVLLEAIRARRGTETVLEHWPWFVRLNVWLVVLMSLLALSVRGAQQFIYFAF